MVWGKIKKAQRKIEKKEINYKQRMREAYLPKEGIKIGENGWQTFVVPPETRKYLNTKIDRETEHRIFIKIENQLEHWAMRKAANEIYEQILKEAPDRENWEPDDPELFDLQLDYQEYLFFKDKKELLKKEKDVTEDVQCDLKTTRDELFKEMYVVIRPFNTLVPIERDNFDELEQLYKEITTEIDILEVTLFNLCEEIDEVRKRLRPSKGYPSYYSAKNKSKVKDMYFYKPKGMLEHTWNNFVMYMEEADEEGKLLDILMSRT